MYIFALLIQIVSYNKPLTLSRAQDRKANQGVNGYLVTVLGLHNVIYINYCVIICDQFNRWDVSFTSAELFYQDEERYTHVNTLFSINPALS